MFGLACARISCRWLAGAVLTASAFLPWVVVGETSMRGVPDVAALWIAGLGALAAVLATLSLITRKNSRHPLLVDRPGRARHHVPVVADHAEGDYRPRAHPFAGARHRRKQSRERCPECRVGSGIYLGLAAACALVAFGLTIVVKRASRPYVVADPDDDV